MITTNTLKRKRDPHPQTNDPNLESATATTTATTAAMDTIVWQTPTNPPHRDDYIFHKGMRYVKPYYFEFICHGKNRWTGKTIVDMFTDEFRGRPRDYYVRAVKSGRILVGGKTVSIYHRIKSSEKISHFVHRHEPPVMAWDVSVLQEGEDVLTVCKPASIPVHSCGQYRKNTVIGILEAEYGFAPLFPIHRLDRLVSGLLILARTASKADTFRQQIEGGLVKKQYVAKVVGIFPEGEKVVDANINHDPREGRSAAEVGDGLADVKLKGKISLTKFRRLHTDGVHSIVQCEPLTGRTHQIRVHLQHIGHPIANDNMYLGESISRRSTEGRSADRTAAKSGDSLSSSACENNVELEEESSAEFSIDPMCTNCPNLAPQGYGDHEEGLWLHCVRYSGPDWSYECPLPDWAAHL
ncbi:RNA pseudouridine synthase 7 isoform X2 [Silene latifolia]|uniref:RNA pseudouridine synthase 7 isoform X2 n=1 Tax=Silene latifolia TaxID=37657 RepID=UPI003D76FB21